MGRGCERLLIALVTKKEFLENNTDLNVLRFWLAVFAAELLSIFNIHTQMKNKY